MAVCKMSTVRKLHLNLVEFAALIYCMKYFHTKEVQSCVAVRSSCSKYSGMVNVVSVEVGEGNTHAIESQGTENCKEAYQSIQT